MSKFDFIVNPATGRKVNVNTRLGQTILTNYKDINQVGGVNIPFGRKTITEQEVEPISQEQVDVTPKPRKKTIKDKAKGAMAKIHHKAAEFERKSPKAAMALKAAGKGGVKAALGLIPGAKSVASGLYSIGRVASQQAFNKSRAVRDQWWEHHVASGNWQRNKDKAELQYSILDHDNSGHITKEEYLNSIPGMHHPDSEYSVYLKEKERIRAELTRKGSTDIHESGELPTPAEINEIIESKNKRKKGKKKLKNAVKKISALKGMSSESRKTVPVENAKAVKELHTAEYQQTAGSRKKSGSRRSKNNRKRASPSKSKRNSKRKSKHRSRR